MTARDCSANFSALKVNQYTMSTAKKQFYVFSELVEVIVSSKETNGTFCVIRQYSNPGGGPPPHIHAKEDEFFTVIDGEFEIFDGANWHPINKGEAAYTLRSNPHTFRNRGSAMGCIQATVIPGGLDEYLEKLSQLSMPPVIEEVVQISDPYGISFLPPQQ
ncbi:cupin domain-containing protein [Terriglobus roseus]|uniref:Cupin domain-containing protein n=1 Tax=Terriglobus roseus TaxID=392734 RepID=A0A1G7FSF1_9BACT|nr:cupin domain-containing protein [Terriglobus roseus]SDE78853.1 Cupin domain-containing protein [Terriglobus roseus]